MDEEGDDGVLDERIQELEQVVARLQAEQGVKEEIALGVITGREVQNTIYGMRGDRESGVPPSSVAKTRFVPTHLSPANTESRWFTQC